MNERIRELAEEAGYTPLKPRTLADDMQEIFLKKFAELIVRECAKLADEPTSRPYESYGIMIKQHFGVKE